MIRKNLLERLSATLFVLLFLFFSLSTGMVMTSPAHAAAMPKASPSMIQDGSTHTVHTSQYSATSVQVKLKLASHTSNACAALCQTSSATNSSASLPISEKEKDDDIFDIEVVKSDICPQATDDPEPVIEERELKVPLYLEYCLLRI